MSEEQVLELYGEIDEDGNKSISGRTKMSEIQDLQDEWVVYLSGEIHSDWRERIRDGINEAGLPVTLVSPVTHHETSDDAGVEILGQESDNFWKDHKGAKVNAIRTRTLIERADVVVVRFGDKYRQWNAAFDAGVEGVLDRIAESGSEAATVFLADFVAFLERFGARGPKEWEASNHVWETRPELALAAIDRMRLADASQAPSGKNLLMAVERERLVAEIGEMLAGDPETQGMFMASANAATVFQAGRERTKTNAIKLIHETRMALHTIGRRMVEAGVCDEVGDYGLLRIEEAQDWLANPGAFTETLRERRKLFDEYSALQEPFVFVGEIADPGTWPRKGETAVASVAVGDVLEGFSGCPGVVTAVARVVLDPIDPTALAPGEILVAPMTDPSWTPLFVAAGGVIVDVGAAQSHAMIVSRELGIACVPSVTDATRRIPDGATVEVNGDAGTVTIVALP